MSGDEYHNEESLLSHELPGGTLPDWAIEGLSTESKECLSRLATHQSPPLPDFGQVRQAAVLVALFQKPGDDQLRVLLTTRGRNLRTHPRQTALPGGKVDPEDLSPIHTARREAFEEVHLPPYPHPNIHHLTILEPVLTILPVDAPYNRHIVVVPVVCFISDPQLLTTLKPNPIEVETIFTHPLKGCLEGKLHGKDCDGLVEKGGEWWPYEADFHTSENRDGVTGKYRMHRFRTVHSPIKGLTSDVLIHTATIAYARPPSFTRFAPNQPQFSTAIANVVLELPGFLDIDQAAAEDLAAGGGAEWGAAGDISLSVVGLRSESVEGGDGGGGRGRILEWGGTDFGNGNGNANRIGNGRNWDMI